MDDGKAAVLSKIRDLRRLFGKAHQDGLEAIQRGDFKRLGKAIRKEGEIIEAQRNLIATFRATPRRH